MSGCECCDAGCGKDIRVSFCPNCKSREVAYVFGLGNLFGVIPKMKCKDCGFDSATFPVLVTNEAELKNAIDGMKNERVKKKASSKKKASKKKVVKKIVRRKKK